MCLCMKVNVYAEEVAEMHLFLHIYSKRHVNESSLLTQIYVLDY